ncbi:hypothetical protein [Pararhodobacter sp. CCB-MM2]|uniref:hypothetical protein n=1 Tax=Pararhodobacter sp. CCB-MM2 TaxID=1786003 RepID=UPI00082B3E56|nr:hypothetical protein [Pararhodobacter sp. CCB-MM2]
MVVAGDGLTPRLTRRALVLGALALGACARVTHGELPEPFGAPVTTPPALRVVIFEIQQPDLPFHTGLVIRTAGETMILDPAGEWEPGHLQCTRDGQVLRRITPELEQAYLTRDGIGYLPDSWTTHVVDIPVPAATAALAAERALAVGPVLPLQCATTVSTLLASLPEFDEIEPGWITADLLRALVLRPGVSYLRLEAASAQGG